MGLRPGANVFLLTTPPDRWNAQLRVLLFRSFFFGQQKVVHGADGAFVRSVSAIATAFAAAVLLLSDEGLARTLDATTAETDSQTHSLCFIVLFVFRPGVGFFKSHYARVARQIYKRHQKAKTALSS